MFMPYIEAHRNGSGSITSYRIVVSTGYDDYGKQIRHRFLWTPPKPGMSEKQMEKEATAAAYKYEEQINNGSVTENNCFTLVRQNKIDGIIALSYSPNLDVDDSIPMVTIDRHFSNSIPCISSDNYQGGRSGSPEAHCAGMQESALSEHRI